MASQSARAAIRAFLDAARAGAQISAPLTYENEPSAQPADSAWVYVRFQGLFYDQASIGAGAPTANRWTEEGSVIFHVRVPSYSGTATAATVAEEIADVLRGAWLQPANIRFQTLSIGDGEMADEEGNFWQLTVRAEWLRG